VITAQFSPHAATQPNNVMSVGAFGAASIGQCDQDGKTMTDRLSALQRLTVETEARDMEKHQQRALLYALRPRCNGAAQPAHASPVASELPLPCIELAVIGVNT
jgi:hypothetical protein